MLGHQDITAVDDITPKIKDVVDSGYLDYDDVDNDGDDDVDCMLMMVTRQDHEDNIYFSLSNNCKYCHYVYMKSYTNIVKCCKGCHPLAYELLCQLVQPVCYSERMV